MHHPCWSSGNGSRSYNFYDNGKGFIILRTLPSSSCNNHKNKTIKGFWGFHGLSFPPLKCLSTPSSQSEDSSSSNNNVIAIMSSPDHTPAMSKTVSSPPSTKNEGRRERTASSNNSDVMKTVSPRTSNVGNTID